MKTKIVYVLTFNENNYYFEQLMLSACSARTHNPEVKIVVVTDKQSAALITGWRNRIYKYINEIKAFELPSGLDKMLQSRWLKTNLRNLIDGDYIFLDTDTLVCDSLEDIDSYDGNIMMVREQHCLFHQKKDHKIIKKLCSRIAGQKWDTDVYFNSGVIYAKDTDAAHKFYSRWHSIWNHSCNLGIKTDQQSLAVTIAEQPIVCELPQNYHCQLVYSSAYFDTAKIIHYFNGKYTLKLNSPLCEENTLKEIRRNEGICEQLIETIKSCRNSFREPTITIAGEDIVLWNSSVSNLLKLLKTKCPFILRILNAISHFLLVILK